MPDWCTSQKKRDGFHKTEYKAENILCVLLRKNCRGQGGFSSVCEKASGDAVASAGVSSSVAGQPGCREIHGHGHHVRDVSWKAAVSALLCGPCLCWEPVALTPLTPGV